MRLIEPYLVDGALVIVDDTDWERVERAVDDYLAAAAARDGARSSDRRQGTAATAEWWDRACASSAGRATATGLSAAISRCCASRPSACVSIWRTRSRVMPISRPIILERLRILVAVEPVAQLDHVLLALAAAFATARRSASR